MFHLPNFQRHRFAKPVSISAAALSARKRACAQRLLGAVLAVAFCLAFALGLLGQAQGGSAVWGPAHGPEGGEITALAIDPRKPATLYAGTEEGLVFKTVEGD